jgi:hypothetical protein
MVVGQDVMHICCLVASSVITLGMVVGQLLMHVGPFGDGIILYPKLEHTQYLRVPISRFIIPVGHTLEFTQSPIIINPVQDLGPGIGIVLDVIPIGSGGTGMFKAVIII